MLIFKYPIESWHRVHGVGTCSYLTHSPSIFFFTLILNYLRAFLLQFKSKSQFKSIKLQGKNVLWYLVEFYREGGDIGMFFFTLVPKVLWWYSLVLGFHWIWIGWSIMLSAQTFQQLIVIYRKCNIVWGCTSIYRPL